jgi:hypothetical protein
LVETALGLELQEGAVIADDLAARRCVFLAGLYRAEREIAEKLQVLAAGKPPWPSIDAGKAIPWVENRTKLALAESQVAAVRVALAERALRPSVIFRKVTGGFRSEWGARTYADALSVIATGRLQGRSALQALSDALAGRPILVPPPRLRPHSSEIRGE